MNSGFALIFGKEEGLGGEDIICITSHPIYKTGKESVIGAGKAFSDGDAENMLKILADKRREKRELLPSTLLAKTVDSMIWYRPATMKTVVRFIGGETGALEFVVPVPNLIFKCASGSMEVCSFKGKGRPSNDTLLYHAPFGNINKTMQMCVGANQVPKYPSVSEISDLEDMFFESEFSELHFNGACKGIDSYEALVNFYKTLEGKERFPTRKMLAVKRSDGESALTLGGWV